MRRLLKDLLEREGWKVTEANDARDGLDKLARIHAELIVVNVLTPGMDSFTFNDVVQRNPRWSRIPIIVLTEKDEASGRIVALNNQLQRALKQRTCDTDRFVSQVRILSV